MSVNHNQQYFKTTHFFDSVFDLKTLPSDNCQEVAFAGRSNCGKSSVINVITQKHKLAIISKTPGRTKSINYFQITDQKYLVDLPGYGYAKVATKTKINWEQLIEKYFVSRKSLTGVVLIMDIRHPFKDFDKQMLLFCSYNNLPTYIVLNKADKLSNSQVQEMLKKVNSELKNWPLASAQIFSAITLIGLDELRKKIILWLEQKAPTNLNG